MARFKIINKYLISSVFLFGIMIVNVFERSCWEKTDLPSRSTYMLDTNEDDYLGCSAIVRGDVTDSAKAGLSRLLAMRNKKQMLTEAFYLNATQDCSAYVKDRGYHTITLSPEEKAFPIAYSMVIHENIEMFERLLRALYTPQNVYCVHIDQKCSDNFRNAVRSIASCLPNVFVASRLERVVYATWSRVQADLNCMEDLLRSPIQWKYLLNTCGTDFPIKTNAEIVQSLRWLNGRNSMESEEMPEHKKSRWQFHYNVTPHSIIRTGVRKTPPPISTPMFSGNAYFVVTREFVKHVFESQEVQNLLEWEKDTYSPDEHLWATLLRMPAVPGSSPPNKKFQYSDMTSIARLVKWSYLEGDVNKGAPYPPCTGTHRRSVCVFGAGDLRWLLRQQHLLANKFDPRVDEVVIKCLETHLHYKALYGGSV